MKEPLVDILVKYILTIRKYLSRAEYYTKCIALCNADTCNISFSCIVSSGGLGMVVGQSLEGGWWKMVLAEARALESGHGIASLDEWTSNTAQHQNYPIKFNPSAKEIVLSALWVSQRASWIKGV